jgi:hypothetical protein
MLGTLDFECSVTDLLIDFFVVEQADSGAPLFCDGNLYATHSRGMACTPENSFTIGVFTPLYGVQPFIRKATGGTAVWSE